MTGLTNPFVWFGILSVLFGLCIAAVAWSQRDSRGARTYAVLMAVLAVWAAMYVVQLLEASAAEKRQWLVARHALTSVIGALFWLFAARYTDRTELLSARYVGPILGVGAVLSLLAVLNPAQLYWTEAVLYTEGSIPRLDITFGPAFWLMTLFVFVVVGGGHVYLVLTLLDSFSVYRRQLTAMAIVGTIEFTLMMIFLTEHVSFVPGVNPWPHVQLITYNMVFVAAPLGWSYLRQSLFDLQVLDRQAVIENMEDAVFVFDTEDVLRRVNDHGRRLLETDDPLEGQSASALFAEKRVLLDAYLPVANSPPTPGSDRQFDRQLEQTVAGQVEQTAGIAISDGDGTNESAEITVDGDRRWYDIRASPIRNSEDEQTGTVLVARDVTAERRRRKMLTERTEELKRKTKTLERQNERLDQFAAVVSHDLRNPLNVAQLRLGLMREDAPEEHAEVVERNLDRMESMIEELLTMARAQTTVEETETVYLASLAEDAWETVPAARATLDIRFDRERTVEGDRELLMNVFENLFRNAVEHGSTSPDSQARQDAVEHGSTSPRSQAPGDAVEHGSTSPDSQARQDAVEHGTPESSDEASGTQLSVRVGPLTDGAFDGFYVEDTGKGIVDLNTEELFEFGQTTAEEGTGLGLAIVRELVRAHGWEISATNASHGGARFEIRTEPDR